MHVAALNEEPLAQSTAKFDLHRVVGRLAAVHAQPRTAVVAGGVRHEEIRRQPCALRVGVEAGVLQSARPGTRDGGDVGVEDAQRVVPARTTEVVAPVVRRILIARVVERYAVEESVVIRICTEPDPALSAPGVDVERVISSTESISGRMYMKNPSPARLLLSWTFTPSSVMLIEPSGNPLMVVFRLSLAVVIAPGRPTT